MSSSAPGRLPVGSTTSQGFGAIVKRVVRPDMPTARKVWTVAWPVVVTNLLQSLALTVDLVMVGALGPVALAATGVATQVFYVGMVIASGLAVGATALVSRAIGAGDREAADRATAISILLSLALAIPLIALTFYADAPLLRLLGADDAIVEQGGLVLRVLAFGIPGNMVMLAATGALQGAGDTRPGLVIGIGVNVVNIVLDYMLIFGHWGAPAMGLAGAAAATAIAFGLGGLAFLWLLWRGRRPVALGRGSFAGARAEAWRLSRIGAPAALEQLVLTLGFTAYLILILRFGAEALAAHQIGLRVQSFAFMPGFGFSAAAAALVGQGLGRGRPEEAEGDGWAAIGIGLLVMMGVSVPMFLAAEPLARLFTSDPESLRLGTLWVRAIVLAMPAIALHFSAAGALRGAGDTRWPLFVSFAGLWIVRIPLAYFLGVTLGLQMIGIWMAYIIEYYLRAIVTTWRFARGRWKTIRI
ncbi:MAG TPA: MATE family efflux transporter [Candidatus Thermoplasmatota archaeon]|nr:MATE family efflux transporter [Candidatus Thermoplasmatota archaeon]